MTPLDDDLLTALRAARPDPGYQPSATSAQARAMLARTIQTQNGASRPARQWWQLAAPGDPPEGGRPVRRRRMPVIIAAATAAAAAATVLALLPPNTSGASPAAAQLLAKIATTAAAQPSPPVRDSQFWYIKSWVSNQVCSTTPGDEKDEKCAVDKPHERQVWQSVSNLCVTGLLRENGQNVPLAFSSACPYRGGMNVPTYRFLQSLPTGPQALLGLIEQQMQGQLPRSEEAFTTIGDLLREAIAPPAVSAALYRAAALIPGVSVVANATDAVGRHGVAVALTFQGVRTEWIFSKQTLQYLGERDIDISNGSTTGEAAVLQRAFVDHAGQIPG